MSEDFSKFVFTGIIIVIVLIGGSRGGFSDRTATLGQAATVIRPSPPPLYILNPPENALVRLENAAVPSPSVARATPETNLLGSQALAAETNSTPAFTRVGKNQLPKIGAQIVLVADLETGERYAGIGTAKRWPLASVTKLMSAVVVMKHMDQNQVVEMTKEDFPQGTFPKDLRIGGRFSVGDLITAALLESSNEAAMAISSSYGRDAFMAQMNTQADVWGLASTHFDDPTGLLSSNNTTADDLFIMARYIFSDMPQIFLLTTKAGANITELSRGETIKLKSINNFAGAPDFLGGKTGFTDDAQQNLLSIFSYSGRPVLIVVLGSNDRFGDTEKLLSWFKSNFRRN